MPANKPKHPAESISIELLYSLKELVELKEMKENFSDDNLDDYNRRKPLAWINAKRLVKKYQFLGVGVKS